MRDLMLKENRSLDRGLQVLETLARHSALSLSDIHRETGLPKSTLRRLLATLVNRRFVRHSISDKLYRITVTLPDIAVNPVPAGLAIVADISLKHALDLTRKVIWPSDIHVLGEHWLQIVETTRKISQFSTHEVPIDLRVSLFGSATGSVCLSRLDEEVVKELFENRTVEPKFRPSWYGLTWQSFQEHLCKVREQGFGERVPNFRSDLVKNDNLSVIAVPVCKDDEVCSAISLLWPKMYISPTEFAGLFLEDLNNTKALIESDLKEFSERQAKNKKN